MFFSPSLYSSSVFVLCCRGWRIDRITDAKTRLGPKKKSRSDVEIKMQVGLEDKGQKAKFAKLSTHNEKQIKAE